MFELDHVPKSLVILGGGVAEGATIFVDIVRETVMAESLPVAALFVE